MINPIVIYFINICDKIHFALLVISFLLMIINLLCLLNKQKTEIDYTTIKVVTCLIFVCWGLVIVIPDSETATQMLIANYITTDMVNDKTQTLDFIKEIMETIKK